MRRRKKMGKKPDGPARNLALALMDVGVNVSISDTPLHNVRNIDGAFMLDIFREIKGNARTEYIAVYPGKDNIIHVAAKDKRWGQIVLSIKEQAREILDPLSYSQHVLIAKKGIDDFAKSVGIDTKNFRNISGVWHRAVKVSSDTQHYLIGRDERQLFIARLTRACTSVKEAHDSLKSNEVRFAEGIAAGKTLRQGEWFLVNATSDELKEIEVLVKSVGVIRKANIGAYAGRRAGKPHVADELIVKTADVLSNGHSVRQRSDVFVRGKISHPDHRTIKLDGRRKVIRNRELESQSAGQRWID